MAYGTPPTVLQRRGVAALRLLSAERAGVASSIKGLHDCINAFSETDYSEDLKQITVPALVLQDDDDQIVALGNSSVPSAKIMPPLGEGLRRCVARLADDACGPRECGSAGVCSVVREYAGGAVAVSARR
ncbi:Non-heme chloroperoxidase [Caballeronia sordidicola]|uniref:Non-heme chloroperoxidase n=1 Tax=Caballeronia sordidicola TaxID=196367 RepID=A0A226XAS7_CABSO|nr:Non-heme chloroperoxidase [Caballeronia sordidicola]